MVDELVRHAGRDHERGARSHGPNLLADQGLNPNAIGPLLRAIDDKDCERLARYQLGEAYRRTDRPSRAAEQFETVTRLVPNDHRAWYGLAQVRAAAGDRTAMLAALSRAFQLRPVYRTQARTDAAFRRYLEDPEFVKLLSGK
jgi:predicted Zn-dependent protease